MKTFGCDRLIHNLALEQAKMFGRKGRSFNAVIWANELPALKKTEGLEFLREVPSHCLQQAMRDLDVAFKRFFKGEAGYPKPWRKGRDESCRFPDPAGIKIGRNHLTLPKIGKLAMSKHRPIQGRIKNVTISREGDMWFASILVEVRRKAPPPRPMVEGGYDLGVEQPVVESDGTIHKIVGIKEHEQTLIERLQRKQAKQKKGSRRRDRTKKRIRNIQAKAKRRRHDGAHKASRKMANTYTHLAADSIRVKNLTASAKGTVEEPGRNVAQKAGLNRAMLNVAPGTIRRMTAYKMAWNGGTFQPVEPYRGSQDCSACERHPADSPETKHLEHGRVSRGRFVCPLCGFEADADVNAARNHLARGRRLWAPTNQPSTNRTTVPGRRALPARGGKDPSMTKSRPSGVMSDAA